MLKTISDINQRVCIFLQNFIGVNISYYSNVVIKNEMSNKNLNKLLYRYIVH